MYLLKDSNLLQRKIFKIQMQIFNYVVTISSLANTAKTIS